MIHSVTFFGVCENIDQDIQGKPALTHGIPPDRVSSESVISRSTKSAQVEI
jgi:hypothetical protein